MRKQDPWIAASALLLAAILARPADASVVTYTLSGYMAGGQDALGLFGVAGASLTGQAFTAVLTRDDALARPQDIHQFPTSSYVTGDAAFSPVSGALTINGHTELFAGVGGEQDQSDDGFSESFQITAQGPDRSLGVGGYDNGFDDLAGPDYHTLTDLSLADSPGLRFFGSFAIFGVGPGGEADVETDGSFTPTALRLDGVAGPGLEPAGVPEPTGWALMILGLGGLGARLRRRRVAAFA
jgi:hypothetical protein